MAASAFGRTPAELREELARLRDMERSARGVTVAPPSRDKDFNQIRAEIAELEAALVTGVGR